MVLIYLSNIFGKLIVKIITLIYDTKMLIGDYLLTSFNLEIK